MPKIWQFITGLNNGGAERIVYEIATRIARADRADVCAVVSFTDGGIYAEKLRDRGVEVFNLNATGKFHALAAIRRLRKLLGDYRPALLHTHLFHANIIGRIAARNLGIPVLSTCHIREKRFRPWHFWLDKLTARFAEGECCVSESTREFQREKTGLPDNFFHTILNGVDLQNFVPAENREALRLELNFPDAPLICGFLGRLDFQKGADILLDALALLSEAARRNFAVAIGGDGAERNKLQAQNTRLRLDNVYFLGEQKSPEKFLAACDIVIMPSRYEGFGLVAVEAQATGAALIASDLPSLREIIRDRETGILTPAENPQALMETLRELLDSPARRSQLAANAQTFAAQFSAEKMVENYRQLYARILSANRA